MKNKAVRVALEAVLAVVIFHAGQTLQGTLGDVLLALGIVVVVYAIVDLLRK